jgi:hypothetical protein
LQDDLRAAAGERFNGRMGPRFLTILTGRKLPKIEHAQDTAPSTV